MTQDQDAEFSYGPGQSFGQFTSFSDTQPPRRSPERRKAVWWMAGGVAVVVAVVVTVLVIRGGSLLTADASLEPGLLTGSDVSGYSVSVLTQDELDDATAQEQALPADISPPECAELLRDQPKLADDTPVGAAKLAGGTAAYVEMITPDNGIESWDPSRATQFAATCGTVTFSESGQSGTLSIEVIDPPSPSRAEHAFAMRFTIEADGVSVTLASAVAKVGDHAVALVGGTSGEFDESEFREIAGDAFDKVARTL